MARNLTPDETAARLREYEAMIQRGAMLKEIAAAWGISLASLREWRGRLGLAPPLKRKAERKAIAKPGSEAARQMPRMDRPCLTCGDVFQSRRADGAWLRMCDRCRAQPISPYTPGGAGHTGRRVGAQRGAAG